MNLKNRTLILVSMTLLFTNNVKAAKEIENVKLVAAGSAIGAAGLKLAQYYSQIPQANNISDAILKDSAKILNSPVRNTVSTVGVTALGCAGAAYLGYKTVKYLYDKFGGTVGLFALAATPAAYAMNNFNSIVELSRATDASVVLNSAMNAPLKNVMSEFAFAAASAVSMYYFVKLSLCCASKKRASAHGL